MLKPALLFIIGLLIFLLPAYSQAQDHGLLSEYRKAEELFKDRQREESGKIFREIENKLCISDELIEECARTKLYLASIERSNRELDSSHDYLDKALAIVNENFDSGHDLLSEIYQGRINTFMESGKFESGMEAKDAALDYIRAYGKQGVTAARVYLAAGNLVDEMGNYSEAVDYYQKSLDAISNSEQEDTVLRILSLVHNNMAFSLRRSGEVDKAMDSYRMALEATKKLFGERHSEVALVYNNIGTIHYLRGDLGQAANYFSRSGDLFRDHYGEEHPRVAGTYNNAAAIYFQMGNLERGSEMLERAQRIKEKTLGTNHIDTAIGYSNLAHVYEQMGRHDEALRSFQKSLRIRQGIYGDDHPSLIEVHRMKGDFFSRTGSQEDARWQYKEADRIISHRIAQKHPERNELQYKIGKSYQLEGNLNNALSHYQLALFGFTSEGIAPKEHFDMSNITYPRHFLRLLVSLGDVTRQIYKIEKTTKMLHESHYYYRWAADVMRHIQTSYASESSKLKLIEEHQPLFSKAIDVCRLLFDETGEQYWLDEMLWFSEAGRSRVALELLNRSEAKAFAGVPESLTDREREISADIARFTQEIHEEIGKREQANEETLVAYRDSLFQARQEMRDYVDELERQFPTYYELKYRSNYTSHEQIAETLRDDEMLVLYSIGDEQISALILTRAEIKFTDLGSSESVAEDVRLFRESAIVTGDRAGFIKMGRKLYKKLIEPVITAVDKPSLIIIPDGPLHYLPFDMLLSDEAPESGYMEMPFLVRQKSISYAPSATLFQKLRERESRQGGKLFAMAPFVNSGINESEIPSSFRGEAVRSQLPLSGFEVQRIASVLSDGSQPPGGASVFVGQEATSQKLLSKDLSEYDFIHFATHAFINEETPELSGILLNGTGQEDGTLYVNDIYTLRLNADLVVLSACETGLGSLIRGEGIIGFTRAFLYSGARGLMVSMWRVSDQPTAELMVSFYEKLRDGKSFSEALRQAKLELISRPELAAPRNWAPFVLQGGI